MDDTLEGNPRRMLQCLQRRTLEDEVLPEWTRLALAHRDFSSSVPRSVEDAIRTDEACMMLSKHLQETLSEAGCACSEEVHNRVKSAMTDLFSKVVDVCRSGWVTWSGFSSYLIDTDERVERWTFQEVLLDRWSSGVQSVERRGRRTTLNVKERKKEGVLLWEEDVHDFAPVLRALQPMDNNEKTRDDELLLTLAKQRRLRDMLSSKKQRSSVRCVRAVEENGGAVRGGAPDETLDVDHRMTPFLMSFDVTAEAADATTLMFDVPCSPFVAAFTRSGSMFLLHRSSRLVERDVGPVSFCSSVSAVAFARRQTFGKVVPGLPSFRNFLAVATASLRLHVLCCRTFHIRETHDLDEPVNSLAYCNKSHLLFGGLASGCVAVWVVSDKGFVKLVDRWSIKGAPSPLSSPVTCMTMVGSTAHDTSAVAKDIEEDATCAVSELECSDMLLVGFQDGSWAQVNIKGIPAMPLLIQEGRQWRNTDAVSAHQHAAEVPFNPYFLSAQAARNVLLFRAHTEGATAASSSNAASSNSAKRLNGVNFLFYSAPLESICGVLTDGTVISFPKDFPTAPHQRFEAVGRRDDDRVVFSAMDSDGTSIVLTDFSTTTIVLSLVSMVPTWKRHLHVTVREGLAERGRAGVHEGNALDSTPRCFCGVALSLPSGIDLLLVNTTDGCIVILLDSVGDPSNGALFSKDADDLLLCEALHVNPSLMVVSNPHQMCVVDSRTLERVAVFLLSTPELLIHPSDRELGLMMTAACTSLDGLRVYAAGSNGTLCVSRLDTGRALWRYQRTTAADGPVIIIACGGVGNCSAHEFLCITSGMQLLVCVDEPHVFEEHVPYSFLRRVSLLSLPRPATCSTATATVRSLTRLPGVSNCYWVVAADSSMSCALWDTKHLDWEHHWVQDLRHENSNGGRVSVKRVPLALHADDSVFTTQWLSPFPLCCIGTLHGEILLVVTKPHVSHGECVARWRQRTKRYQRIKQQPPCNAPSADESESTSEPALTAFALQEPFTLLSFDATSTVAMWDISDIILQLRCVSVFDTSRMNAGGTAQRIFVHAVPRPPVVRFIWSQCMDVVVMKSFWVRRGVLATLDSDSRVATWKLDALSMAASGQYLVHINRHEHNGADGSSIQHNTQPKTVVWHRARKVFHAVRALWRMYKCVPQSISGRKSAFTCSAALIVCAPSYYDDRFHVNHRTFAITQELDDRYLFTNEGDRPSSDHSPGPTVAVSTITTPSRETRHDVLQQGNPSSTSRIELCPRVRVRMTSASRAKPSSVVATTTGHGRSKRPDSAEAARSRCFSYDPETQPSYYALVNQSKYLQLDRNQRSQLAVSFRPRIVTSEAKPNDGRGRGNGNSNVADTRDIWQPFPDMQCEVESMIPCPDMHLPKTPPPLPFSQAKPLRLDQLPKSLVPPRQVCREVTRPHVVTSAIQNQTRKVGFVKIPIKEHAHATTLYFI